MSEPRSRFEVVSPGLFDLVVDTLPRRALHLGFSETGPLDLSAFLRAGRRAGDPAPDRSAGLEFLLRGPTLLLRGDPVRAAVAGGAIVPVLNGNPLAVERPFVVPSGGRLELLPGRQGLRGYLAVRGGFVVPSIWGSRSADLPSGLPELSGRPLRRGDILAVAQPQTETATAEQDVRMVELEPEFRSGCTELRVLPGPEWPLLPKSVRQHLLRPHYRVSTQANRVGVRFTGPPPPEADGKWKQVLAGLPSQGNAPGCVQLPPDGEPIVLLADRGPIGGYIRPLQMIAADQWRLAQIRPGQKVQFVPTTRRAAWLACQEALGSQPRQGGDRCGK